MIAFALENFFKLDVIIDLTIMNDRVSVQVVHGLCCSIAEVDYGKAAVAKEDCVFFVGPYRFAIWTTVSNCMGHFF